MLQNLTVRNLALIEEEEINFGPGLNILSGETGAGKSIILGALHLALGDKAPRELLRQGEEEGFVEATFTIDNESQKAKLEELDLDTSEGEIILSRRISAKNSVAKINGEKVPAGLLKSAGEIFLDIYGQNDSQLLLNAARHLEILDSYGAATINPLKDQVAEIYGEYRRLRQELDAQVMDESQRAREVSFLEHEISEIENARLVPGEDADLEEEYRRMSNSGRIAEALGEVEQMMGDSTGDAVARALRALHSVSEYDESIGGLADQLSNLENLLSDFNRDLDTVTESLSFDPGEFARVENRLNLVNELKMKFGRTIEEVNASLEEKKARLEALSDYEAHRAGLQEEYKKTENRLQAACEALSGARRSESVKLTFAVTQVLLDLNFLDVKFTMEFQQAAYTENGFDQAEFYISPNPGEPLKPLKNIASGGELSRIMLALKTVSAKDGISSLIFDEVDAGISGRTAQAVADRLQLLAEDYQVICITHLPQIAAYADTHFCIEKQVVNASTVSSIRPLSEEDAIEELARMLGGSLITENTRSNARELRQMARRK